MVTFIALYGADPEDFLNDEVYEHSDAHKLALNTHRYIHEHLDNQVEAAAVVTDEDLHDRLEAVWNDENNGSNK